jgi:hypothetical protein
MDGGPQIPAQVADLPPPPRLCEAGPCRNYHRLVKQLDSQNPLPVMRDGVLVSPAGSFHVETHHYCYPDVGIETDLQATPVIECNRWEPRTDKEILVDVKRLTEFKRSKRGKAFKLAQQRWNEDRADERAAELALEPPTDS